MLNKGPAPRASSDAPLTFPLKTSGALPRCSRQTTALQACSASGRPCDRHHSRLTSPESRRSRASESRSPAPGPLSTSNLLSQCLCARQFRRRCQQQHTKQDERQHFYSYALLSVAWYLARATGRLLSRDSTRPFPTSRQRWPRAAASSSVG